MYLQWLYAFQPHYYENDRTVGNIVKDLVKYTSRVIILILVKQSNYFFLMLQIPKNHKFQ